MDITEAVEELACSVMSCSMECEEKEAEPPPSTPAEKSLPERVMDVHIDEQGNKFYLVKWFGFSDDECTWESESNLNEIAIFSPYLLDEFNKRQQGEQNREDDNDNNAPCLSLQDMAVTVDFGNAYGGYEFASPPEQVLGVIERGDDHDFLVKWHGMDAVEVIPRSVANQIWPEMVIKYYEENLIWRNPDNEQEQ